jgi:hypothetical protein
MPSPRVATVAALSSLLVLGPGGVAHASPVVGCSVDAPCVQWAYQEGSTVIFEWDGYRDWDHYNVRWARDGRGETQHEVAGGSGGKFSINKVNPGLTYWINVQGCDRDFLGYSDCGPWSEGNGVSSVTTATRDACKSPFVWRLARPSDKVCVTEKVARQTAEQNRTAAERRSPNGGAYGPDTCKQGYVWREAFNGDVVCVTPAVRERTWKDNAESPKRKYYA